MQIAAQNVYVFQLPKTIANKFLFKMPVPMNIPAYWSRFRLKPMEVKSLSLITCNHSYGNKIKFF